VHYKLGKNKKNKREYALHKIALYVYNILARKPFRDGMNCEFTKRGIKISTHGPLN